MFDYAGDFSDGVSDLVHTRVSASGQAQDFSITKSSNWNLNSDLGWDTRSLTFTAVDTTTDISFQTLNEALQDSGLIGGVRILEITPAISTILNNDTTLSYDAATGKFYRYVTSVETCLLYTSPSPRDS